MLVRRADGSSSHQRCTSLIFSLALHSLSIAWGEDPAKDDQLASVKAGARIFKGCKWAWVCEVPCCPTEEGRTSSQAGMPARGDKGPYDVPGNSFAAGYPSFPHEFVSLERGGAAEEDRSVRSTFSGGGAGRLPRILLMGLRRSGKTSIFKVVFHKLPPHETLFLESTAKTVRHHVQNSCVVDLKVWDFAGSADVEDSSFDAVSTFETAGALLFVIDAQDDYLPAINKLVSTVERAFQVNRGLFFEIFIHKVDGVQEDKKLDLQRDISHQVTSALNDRGLEEANIAFYLSSIYDHSVYENVSKVVQKLVPQLGMLENLLDILISNCRMEKAFLFDVLTKIYIATDSQPVDVESFELCSDMIDAVVDVSCIYGQVDDSEALPFDEKSYSIIKLSSGRVLVLREVSKYLALVCLMRAENLELQGLIEYNVHTFKQALKDLVRPTQKTPRQSISHSYQSDSSFGPRSLA